MKVLSYHICNISDDKPKFLISKCYEIMPNSYQDKMIRPKIMFKSTSDDMCLDRHLDDYFPIEYTSYVEVQMPNAVPDGMSFELYYPEDILQIDDSKPCIGY